MNKPMTLRMLPVGMSFYLLRTMQRCKLVKAGPSAIGGYRYDVEIGSRKTYLHHSCHIKPIIRASDAGLLTRPTQTHPLQTSGHAVLKWP